MPFNSDAAGSGLPERYRSEGWGDDVHSQMRKRLCHRRDTGPLPGRMQAPPANGAVRQMNMNFCLDLFEFAEG